jgi:hypothetical protein
MLKLDNKNHKYINQILTIQKFVINYILVPQSYYQTKEWRKSKKWYITGKLNECEKFQINNIEKILKNKLKKTFDRINIETIDIISKKNININDDGYEWTENFDGLIINNNDKYYFNLKFVCDIGGAQTRTLREVYHFIKYQMEYLIKLNTNNIYFINILDGDTCYKNMHKFNYLINKDHYKSILNFVFIGSLYDFQKSKIKLKMVL